MKKLRRTKIHPKIQKLSKSLGLKLCIGTEIDKYVIYKNELISDMFPSFVVGAYLIGTPYIYIKEKSSFNQIEMNIVMLHEIGHAVIGNFIKQKDVSDRNHEIKANAIALGFAAQLNLPVPKHFVKKMIKYTKTKTKVMSL